VINQGGVGVQATLHAWGPHHKLKVILTPQLIILSHLRGHSDSPTVSILN